MVLMAKLGLGPLLLLSPCRHAPHSVATELLNDRSWRQSAARGSCGRRGAPSAAGSLEGNGHGGSFPRLVLTSRIVGATRINAPRTFPVPGQLSCSSCPSA